MITKLGDIASYINGYAIKPSDWSDIGAPIIRIQDLTGNSYKMNRFNGAIDQKYEIQDGDILISWSASLGIYVWKGEKSFLNQHIFKVILDESRVSKPFYIYQVEYILEKAGSQAHGATMKHLTKPVFNALPFYLPNLEKQQRIAKILECVSDLIQKHKEQIDTLNKLVKSRFIELFGDPIKNTQHRPTTAFTNVVTMQRGFDLPVQNRKRNGTIPVFGSNGVLDYHNQAKVYNGGVITGRSGTIGKVFYTEEAYWPLNTTLFSVDTHGNNIIYLAHLLMIFNLDRFTEGTGVPTLNRNKFHSVPIIDVPINEQIQFATFVKQVDKSKLAVQQGLQELETLKKSLMQQYFG